MVVAKRVGGVENEEWPLNGCKVLFWSNDVLELDWGSVCTLCMYECHLDCSLLNGLTSCYINFTWTRKKFFKQTQNKTKNRDTITHISEWFKIKSNHRWGCWRTLSSHTVVGDIQILWKTIWMFIIKTIYHMTYHYTPKYLSNFLENNILSDSYVTIQ